MSCTFRANQDFVLQKQLATYSKNESVDADNLTLQEVNKTEIIGI